MRKKLYLVCLSAALMLHGADKLKINKPGNESQLFELSGISNLSFNNPATAKLKINKPDGTSQLVDLSAISNISFSSSSIETTEFLSTKGINLLKNYPNPFNPSTTISFMTETSGLGKVEIFNQAGQLVSTLFNGKLAAGHHNMQWNAQKASAGAYFLRVSHNGETVSNKILLVK